MSQNQIETIRNVTGVNDPEVMVLTPKRTRTFLRHVPLSIAAIEIFIHYSRLYVKN
jgi:hypothetical protein